MSSVGAAQADGYIPPPDGYEPDGTISSAVELPLNTAQAHSGSGTGDYCWVKFRVEPGKTYSLSALSQPGAKLDARPDMSLWQDYQTELANERVVRFTDGTNTFWRYRNGGNILYTAPTTQTVYARFGGNGHYMAYVREVRALQAISAAPSLVDLDRNGKYVTIDFRTSGEFWPSVSSVTLEHETMTDQGLRRYSFESVGFDSLVDEYGRNFSRYWVYLPPYAPLGTYRARLVLDTSPGPTTYYPGAFAGPDIQDSVTVTTSDHTPPVTTANCPTSWVSTEAVDVELCATDGPYGQEPISGVDSIRYVIDGIENTYSAPVRVSQEGRTILSFSAVDNAGNREASKTAEVLIDRTPPVSWSNCAAVYDGPTTVSLTAEDALSGLVDASPILYRLDQGEWQAGDSVPVDEAGDHVLEYLSIDAAGNVETIHRQQFRILEHLPPRTVVISPGDGWLNGDAHIELSASDDGGSGVRATWYRGNDGVTRIVDQSTVTVSHEGTSTIEFWSVDRDGNEEFPHQTVTVRVDKTPPLTSSNATSTYVGMAVVKFGAEDQLSGVHSTEWSLDGGPWNVGDSLIAYEGTHTVAFRSTDRAGNLEQPKTAVIKVVKQLVPTSLRLSGRGYGARYRTYTLGGTVTPSDAPGSVRIVIKRFYSGKWRQVGSTRTARLTGGRFSYGYRPSYRGTWRFYAVYGGASTTTRTYRPSATVYKTISVR